MQLHRGQKGQKTIHRTPVDAMTLRKSVQVVELLKEPGGWLMNCANDGSTFLGQRAQQVYALVAVLAVQSAEKDHQVSHYWYMLLLLVHFHLNFCLNC